MFMILYKCTDFQTFCWLFDNYFIEHKSAFSLFICICLCSHKCWFIERYKNKSFDNRKSIFKMSWPFVISVFRQVAYNLLLKTPCKKNQKCFAGEINNISRWIVCVGVISTLDPLPGQLFRIVYTWATHIIQMVALGVNFSTKKRKHFQPGRRRHCYTDITDRPGSQVLSHSHLGYSILTW